jgi:disulfide bond formation protein DsbB
MLIALAAVLTAAMVMQYAFGEIPCPLCLLQRYAMFGCCFGIVMQLRSPNSERGAGIGAIFAVVLLVISVRQTLLDLFPRPGHAYVGSAVFGIHMPVWSVLIAGRTARRLCGAVGFVWCAAIIRAQCIVADDEPPDALPRTLCLAYLRDQFRVCRRSVWCGRMPYHRIRPALFAALTKQRRR